jgi:protein TonB
MTATDQHHSSQDAAVIQAIESPHIDTGDRLSFTIFIALALHGLLVLGVGFSYKPNPKPAPTFEVTLATYKSLDAPEKADFQAQFNQEASGTENKVQEITSDRIAPFADTRAREAMPLPEVQAVEQNDAAQQAKIATENSSALKIAKLNDAKELEAQEQRQGLDRNVPLVNPEIASLRAKLARQQQAYANKPRIRRLTSVSTTAAADAEYLNAWRTKIELVGNDNFPQQALNEGIFGQLRLLTTVKANGTIVDVELMQSSGYSILDNAAMQIVHLAAPFAPFPPEISKDTDQLEIIRTWRFDITGLSTSN